MKIRIINHEVTTSTDTYDGVFIDEFLEYLQEEDWYIRYLETGICDNLSWEIENSFMEWLQLDYPTDTYYDSEVESQEIEDKSIIDTIISQIKNIKHDD